MNGQRKWSLAETREVQFITFTAHKQFSVDNPVSFTVVYWWIIRDNQVSHNFLCNIIKYVCKLWACQRGDLAFSYTTQEGLLIANKTTVTLPRQLSWTLECHRMIINITMSSSITDCCPIIIDKTTDHSHLQSLLCKSVAGNWLFVV